MPERRLAITLKGAVSLGAYEAGAIAETLRLIAYNNTQPAATPWYIDAACGASAGSITSGIVAAALLRGNADVLRNTWVSGVSLAMLAPVNQKMSDDTILDALALDALARRNLTCPTTANPHPAMRPAPSQLHLRFTLSRFSPEVISEDTLNRTKLSFHDFKDSADFMVGISKAAGSSTTQVNIATTGVASAGYHNANPDLSGADAWSALVQTAIASGSFPFAFAPRDLRRWVNGGWMDQYFQDGGTFDNDPIGQTINIAHEIDWASTPQADAYDDADRRFLMIHVEPFRDSPPETVPNAPLTLDLNPLTLAGRYFPSIMEESESSGLYGIIGVNAKIVERGKFLEGLVDLVQSGAAQALPPALMAALAKFRGLQNRVQFFLRHMIPDLAQSEPAVFAKVNHVLGTDAQKGIFANLALAYDLATDLTDKTRLTPILIAPAEQLSGSGLYAFGGFLVSQMRERDYAQGVFDAYQAWATISQVPLEEFRLAPDAPDAPASAAELFPSLEDEYKKGIERLIERVDAVLGAVSSAAAGSGIVGDAEAFAMRTVLDTVAKYYLRKNASEQ